MGEFSATRVWTMRAVYLALALIIILGHLVPVDTTPRSWAPADLLVAMTFAWTLRRPDFVPAISVAVALLTADLLLQRPPGLGALLVVLGCEYLKIRSDSLRDAGFAGEWAVVSLVLVTLTMGDRLALMIVAADQPPLPLSLSRLVLTVAVYPLVVLASQGLFGVRKPAPGATDRQGARA